MITQQLLEDLRADTVTITLTRQEAEGARASLNDWVIRIGRKRFFPWRRLGWADSMIYSRGVYAEARAKIDEALSRPPSTVKG